MLIAIDGSLSAKNNSASLGLDARGRRIGKAEEGRRSSVRLFFEECGYAPPEKFYFVGPDALGIDSDELYFDVMELIERRMAQCPCRELTLVGFSRGAAIACEVAEGVAELAATGRRMAPTNLRVGKVGTSARRRTRYRAVQAVPTGATVPRVKYLGLFDSVAMAAAPSPPRLGTPSPGWGDRAHGVDYFAHVLSQNRKGPLPMVKFIPMIPEVTARVTRTWTISGSKHGEIGSDVREDVTQKAYEFITNHARLAGVP